MTDRQRLNYIDVCKAVGIILVVLGHTYSIPDWLHLLIYSFHMPLFFILSGYVYNREKNRDLGYIKFLIRIAKKYMIPYFVFSVVNMCIEILWRIFITKDSITIDYFITKIKGILFCYSNMENTPNCSPLWFLVCLFFASALFWWIIKISMKYNWLLVIGALVINYVFLPYCTEITSFPFKFPTFFVAVFFIYIGYCFRIAIDTYYCKFKRITIFFFSVISILIGVVLTLLLPNKVDMNTYQYGNYIEFLFVSILISFGLIVFIRLLDSKNKFLLWLGKNTIYVIGINFFCRDISSLLYYHIPIIKRIPLHWSVSFVLTFAFCLIGIKLCVFSKKYFNRILGSVYIKQTENKEG